MGVVHARHAVHGHKKLGVLRAGDIVHDVIPVLPGPGAQVLPAGTVKLVLAGRGIVAHVEVMVEGGAGNTREDDGWNRDPSYPPVGCVIPREDLIQVIYVRKTSAPDSGE